MDIKEIFTPESNSIFYVKLVGGEALMGRSNDSTEEVNDHGCLELWDVLKCNTRLIMSENGEVSEVMILTPWLEGCDLQTVASIPIDTVVAIAECRRDIIKKYTSYVLAYKIKAAAYEDQEILAELCEEQAPTEENSLTIAQQAVAVANRLASKQAATKNQPMVIEAQEPRKPELLTRERMMEAESNNDLELPTEEANEDEAEPHYKVGSVTVH